MAPAATTFEPQQRLVCGCVHGWLSRRGDFVLREVGLDRTYGTVVFWKPEDIIYFDGLYFYFCYRIIIGYSIVCSVECGPAIFRDVVTHRNRNHDNQMEDFYGGTCAGWNAILDILNSPDEVGEPIDSNEVATNNLEIIQSTPSDLNIVPELLSFRGRADAHLANE
ncbi:potassium channel [Penicillium waksmanii]|uniref:potassium channel n=1 Tax=Penicillium waksmanii TaxID=69791 RepID=UPI002547175D|nr:potassium channel [Penicillium waksmanii]KAJ5975600.1 potassium channel [Penicillium waksmanii]